MVVAMREGLRAYVIRAQKILHREYNVFVPQLHCRPEGDWLDLDAIEPVRNFLVKPRGGLWTSTFTPNKEFCSAWVKWCAYEMPDWLSDNCYVLWPRKTAKIYIIDRYKHLEALAELYGVIREKDIIFLNWENIAKFWDAVHVTENGVWSTNKLIGLSLYGWDCESTIWFRNVFARWKHISEIPHRCRLK